MVFFLGTNEPVAQWKRNMWKSGWDFFGISLEDQHGWESWVVRLTWSKKRDAKILKYRGRVFVALCFYSSNERRMRKTTGRRHGMLIMCKRNVECSQQKKKKSFSPEQKEWWMERTNTKRGDIFRESQRLCAI